MVLYYEYSETKCEELMKEQLEFGIRAEQGQIVSAFE